MLKRTAVLVLLGLSALSDGVPSAGAQSTTVFQVKNKANGACIRVESPPPTAIIAGVLRTFQCGKAPSELLEVTNDRPAFLRFKIAQGDTRCINVRAIDTQKLPSDVFANGCTSPTSKWDLGEEDAEGFGAIRLFAGGTESRGLCLSLARSRRTVVIDACKDTREQKWKLVPVAID